MGVVIRPPAFRNGNVPFHLTLMQSRSRGRRRLRVLSARFFNVRVVALAVALMALAWILALAGTAFAVRTMFVLCFAALAGRTRRVGVPVRIARLAERRPLRNY